MAIYYNEENQTFHLQSVSMSYVIEITKYKHIAHVYWGRKIQAYHGANAILYRDRGFAANIDQEDRTYSLDTLPQEYPQYGIGDYRPCAYQIKTENQHTYSHLRYTGYEIIKGKPSLTGLPASFGDEEEVETLLLHTKDKVLGLCVDLQYSLYTRTNIMTRSVSFHSEKQTLHLQKMLSMSIDIRNDKFDLISMYGAHNNERNLDRRRLTSATTLIESTRGASSPQQNPFLILCNPLANEDYGDVYTFQFVYSGNFQASVHVDPYRNTRVQMGLQPFDCEWLLKKGESFQTPEVIMSYTPNGLTQMSHNLSQFYHIHLSRSKWTNKIRPILINNWEATYFAFDEDRLLTLAKEAQEVGVELFVLDDGWFKKRNTDCTSLGDWVVDKQKLPHGLSYISKNVHSLGMMFGIWFEPEMISVDSDVYRKHPEYVMQVEGREHIFCRNQLVLDLSNPEVCDYVIESIRKVLLSTEIEYVKWDMNRHLTNIGSLYLKEERQRECAHRYMLGLYHIMDTLTKEFKDVLFESCSSGGGRFDLGMLYYMPQIWTSDNTDAICRLKIQYASSYMFPNVALGAHVSTCPNHQVGRKTPLKTRADVAMCASLGYELSLQTLSKDEKKLIKEQIEFYKEIRETIQFGHLYRLHNPFEENITAFNMVSKDQKKCIVFYFKTLSEPAAPFVILKIKGLKEGILYQEQETKNIYDSSELMYAGISIENVKEDFISRVWHFKKVEGE